MNCKVEGCTNEAVHLGYCWRHYGHIRKYGEIRGNPCKTMFSPNVYEIDLKNNIAYIYFNDLLGNQLKEKALIDLEDLEKVKEHKWYLAQWGYVKTKWKLNIFLHHFVLSITPEKGVEVDHINQNKLDHRKINLRMATHNQNAHNRGVRADNKSGFKGVFYWKSTGRWRAFINKDSKRKYLGFFDTKEEAALAYNQAALTLHGNFACLNNVKGGDSY